MLFQISSIQPWFRPPEQKSAFSLGFNTLSWTSIVCAQIFQLFLITLTLLLALYLVGVFLESSSLIWYFMNLVFAIEFGVDESCQHKLAKCFLARSCLREFCVHNMEKKPPYISSWFVEACHMQFFHFLLAWLWYRANFTHFHRYFLSVLSFAAV